MDLRQKIEQMSADAVHVMVEVGGALNPDTALRDQAVAGYEALFNYSGIPLTAESVAGAQLACLNLAEVARQALAAGDNTAVVRVFVQALGGVHGFARALSGVEGNEGVRALLDGVELGEGQ